MFVFKRLMMIEGKYVVIGFIVVFIVVFCVWVLRSNEGFEVGFIIILDVNFS